jgi:hypothetical protein
MKLDRNLPGNNGYGKYALVKLREVKNIAAYGDINVAEEIAKALRLLKANGVLDYGDTVDSEFFVMRLKDRCAGAGIREYSHCAMLGGDVEWGQETQALSERAGPNHPSCKKPD